jgi:hypothetical protein
VPIKRKERKAGPGDSAPPCPAGILPSASSQPHRIHAAALLIIISQTSHRIVIEQGARGGCPGPHFLVRSHLGALIFVRLAHPGASAPLRADFRRQAQGAPPAGPLQGEGARGGLIPRCSTLRAACGCLPWDGTATSPHAQPLKSKPGPSAEAQIGSNQLFPVPACRLFASPVSSPPEHQQTPCNQGTARRLGNREGRPEGTAAPILPNQRGVVQRKRHGQ